MSDLVSVIIPVYNRKKLITRAIKSVLSQTYKNFEIIIIDDASTDETKKVVVEFNDIILLDNKNKPGPAGARNTGIEFAKGKYLAFLDSDDYWAPDKLQKQITAMQKENIQFSFTGVSFENYSGDNDFNIPEKGFIFKELIQKSFICTSSVILKKEVTQKTGLFDENIFGTEDLDLWLRVAFSFQALYIQEPLVTYTRNDDAIMTLSGKREGQVVDRFADRLKILNKLKTDLPLNSEQKKIIQETISKLYFYHGNYLNSFYEKPALLPLLSLLKLPFKCLRKVLALL